MFDKLIESNTAAELKPRRSYFMVSTVVVGLLFLAAVVASIYAGEIGVGNGDLEMSELIAPIEPAEQAPEPDRPQPRDTRPQASQSTLPSRQENMARPDEPQFAPDKVSTVPNQGKARPIGNFIIDRNAVETDGSSPVGTGRGNISGDPNGTGLTASQPTKTEEPKDEKDAPPTVTKKPAPQSLGVINGRAAYLPKPAYPAAATALHLEGQVNVQVTIDESGKVVSAKAVSGHPLLRSVSERAAMEAKFTPTKLSNVPVKVTGVIVYNFTRN